MEIRCVYVEKKEGFDVAARQLRHELTAQLGIEGLDGVRIFHRYQVQGISDAVFREACRGILAEPPVDHVYGELPDLGGYRVFAIEYLPGQYDQRADSAAQCIQILTQQDRPLVRTAQVIALEGGISEEDYERIRDYCVNPIEARFASLDTPDTLEMAWEEPEAVDVVTGFTAMDEAALLAYREEMGFAMDDADIAFCRAYFRDTERRDPTVAELRMIDTYWSDHCRHTTFLTHLDQVDFDEGMAEDVIRPVYETYLSDRAALGRERPVCLMDVATLAMKKLKAKGKLSNLDLSDEINACSIVVPVTVDGEIQEWLVMFKNETHNHPTEIEPFGGAATCLGGAIRDPLSGRAYVYQAMRVTGSGDPTRGLKGTLPGKLPQAKITLGAAAGYSSYGNQIGLATGQVTEIYDEGYVAKRMEIGAVIGAAPRDWVTRAKPAPGDVVVLLGGRTGRDGCGGATGSSKAHTQESLASCGAEVQKGNPPEERKIQRLFRNPAATRLIKKCNDFGAGGVSVAVGELADGLAIDLDAVPKKYQGLDGTELAISESQERMAVLLAPGDVEVFIALAGTENLEATPIAAVTEAPRLRMKWQGSVIVDLSRAFIDTNGAQRSAAARVTSPKADACPLMNHEKGGSDLRDRWLERLSDLNVCSQQGLIERFDSTIGAGSVLMPYGGIYQRTPEQGMAAKIPVLGGHTHTGTVMTHGFDPRLSRWSPFHGAAYAIMESMSRAACLGADWRDIRMSFQEYFERLRDMPARWGKPLAALLGAYWIQDRMGIAAIGGKDSMSGSFDELDVPPTLVSFAVAPMDVRHVCSSACKGAGHQIICLSIETNDNMLPDTEALKSLYDTVHDLIAGGRALACRSAGGEGLAAALSKMAFGNNLGLVMADGWAQEALFAPGYGSVIVELADDAPVDLPAGVTMRPIGRTVAEPVFKIGNTAISIDDMLSAWESPLQGVFPTDAPAEDGLIPVAPAGKAPAHCRVPAARPRVFIPVFPGTNCEYDSASAFEKAGAVADVLVFRNQNSRDIEESLKAMADRIKKAQMVMIPGGFSAGDEPEGSGKFIAAVFRNPMVRDAVMALLTERDGLMLGICNGFQALIKLGLLPYGEIREIGEDAPTLTYNTIGRHMSRLTRTKVVNARSPWLALAGEGSVHTVAVSHGEGRFVADDTVMRSLVANGQIATQYVDLSGEPTMDMPHNPNGSMNAVEGITSPDGRILGKMGHAERAGECVFVNVAGDKDQRIFASGVAYYK
jgi:phosphoribosylformylglycinamidine synthase